MNQGYTHTVRNEFTCVSCGYSLRGVAIDELCPECGTPVAYSLNRNQPTAGSAVAGMVLGIVSIIGCFIYGIPSMICGPLAIYFSIQGRKQYEAGDASPGSRSMAQAGLIMGIIGTCLAAVGLLFFLLAIVGVIAGP
mgnify:CR=1 FL=1